MTARTRLLVWTDATAAAGAEQALATLVSHLPPDLDVTVAASHPEILDMVARGRPSTLRLVVPQLANKRDLPATLRVARLLRQIRPDVLHLNKTDVGDLRYVELVARLVGSIRVVSVVHHVEPPATGPARALARWLAARAEAVVAVGRRPARDLEIVLGLPDGQVVAIPNALPIVDTMGTTTDRRRSSPGALTVGVLARLVPHKAVDRVVAAVAAVEGVRLLIGGEGPERARLQRQIWHLGVADRVELLGWVPPERVLEHCDVVVSAARLEGHPMALLDARRRGLPIVATDVGAVADIVEHDVTGLLVEPDDLTGLCAAIDRLARDVELRRSFGRAALAAAAANPPPTMARAYLEIYRRELSAPPTTPIDDPVAVRLGAGGGSP